MPRAWLAGAIDFPEAVASEAGKELLKIQLPWPGPAPHAPVFVWLRGEAKGRATGVKY